eukprot:gene42676-52143_t
MSATAVVALDDAGVAKLAQGFYNDAFWFAQQACSSPRLLAWVGSDAQVDAAAPRFWAALAAELKRRDAAEENSGAMTMARLAASFEYAAAGLAHLGPNTLGSYPLRLVLDQGLNATVKEIHCGNGLFLEQRAASLAALAPQFSDREQTLSVFGFGTEELTALMQAVPPRAIDRLVPIGQALDFSPVWDGQDLILSFSRTRSLSSPAPRAAWAWPWRNNCLPPATACLVARYAIWTALFTLPMGLAQSVGIYLLYNWFASNYIFINFALSHTHLDVVAKDDVAVDWVRYAAIYTMNVHPGPLKFVSWWMSYLNFQVEHHLFPCMPQFRHPRISKRVQAFFEKHGLKYDQRSYFEAMQVTFANLHKVGSDVFLG